jgi:hypothetical protein
MIFKTNYTLTLAQKLNKDQNSKHKILGYFNNNGNEFERYNESNEISDLNGYSKPTVIQQKYFIKSSQQKLSREEIITQKKSLKP